MRILFVITGLATGGAEQQLLRLVPRLAQDGFSVAVLALRGGDVEAALRVAGVPVVSLGLCHPQKAPVAMRALLREVRAFKPDVIQGWMYHGNLAATVACRLAMPRARLYWGIRQSLYDLAREKILTRWVIRFSAWSSRWPTAIIYNSHTARVQHERFGFCEKQGMVIDNGFDVETFSPQPLARAEVRRMLGLEPIAPLIGLIARYHPMKGHDVFLKAAVLLAGRRADVHFLLVGREVSPRNPALAAALQHPALAGRVHCLGERRDIARLTAALDIASSSSWGEAFPNAIGEAMSCGIPCVATDVGDVARIIGDTGIVVPAGDANALAEAWSRLLDAPVETRQAMGEAARSRVRDNFSIESVADRYARLYRDAP